MQAKLTLSLDRNVIEQAKELARRQHRSLSKMVENYLQQVTRSSGKNQEPVTPLVAELSGVISQATSDERRGDYADYLAEKYR